MSAYKKGCEYARDLILCTIISISNDTTCMPGSEKDKAYTEVYQEIVNRYGDLFEEWKS